MPPQKNKRKENNPYSYWIRHVNRDLFIEEKYPAKLPLTR